MQDDTLQMGKPMRKESTSSYRLKIRIPKHLMGEKGEGMGHAGVEGGEVPLSASFGKISSGGEARWDSTSFSARDPKQHLLLRSTPLQGSRPESSGQAGSF